MSTARRLFRELGAYRWGFLAAAGCMLVSSVLDGATVVMLIPLLKHLFGSAGALSAGSSWLERFSDAALAPVLVGTTQDQAIARIVGLMVGILLLKNLAGYGANQIGVAVQEGVVRDLRIRLFRHMLTLDLGVFQRTRAGQLIQRIITDVDQIKSVINTSLARFFQNFSVILVTLAALTATSWRLTVLAVGAAPVLVLGLRGVLKRLRRHSRDRAEEWGEITSYIAERLGAIKLIRGYGVAAQEAARFDAQASDYRRKVIRTNRYSSLTSPISEMFGGLVLIMLLVGGTRPWVTGGGVPLSPATLITFLVLALRMMSPIKQISQFPADLAMALASADRVFQLLDEPGGEADAPGARPASFSRELAFDHVSFSYDGERQVLRDISFLVPRGQAVALVGPSGAGKTTLVELLPRLHDPTSGEVRLDGVPLPRFTRASLRGLIGMVSQETVLLNDTVRNNIAFGRRDATDLEVEAAARAANAHDFIADLPRGYATVLGERGTRLSGGQRQRIAIARALLRDPPILLLDEATSALDTESERLVQEAIERLMQDRTVLVIAHRLATVRHADRILVIEDGRIVEQGTHDDLYRQGGMYRRLYDLQFRDEPSADPDPAAA
ncbi:MAG TPA: ABC transporter ATP-binding protein [Gemmatimonadales bacterium]|nr:ABC transporter ATP-binding protein [Gemmatimonadales bacterium]